MKNNFFLCLSAIVIVMAQSCRKSEVTHNPAAAMHPANSIANSSGLKLDNVGDYGTFQFLSNSGQSGEISGLSLDDGGTADLTDYTGISHQKWLITNVSGSYYTIMNLGSGKYMESYNYNGGQVLIQNSATGADAQLWNLLGIGGKNYKAINKASSLAITSNGNNLLQLTTYTGATTQIWGYNQLPVDSYRDDNVVGFFHRTHQNQGSVAFDQGNSIPLADGRVLWIAEDSFDGGSLTSDGNIKCNFIFSYRNSVLIQPASRTWDNTQTVNITTNQSTDGRPKQVFNIQPNTQWTWPGPGIEIGSKVYVSAGEGNGLSATGSAIYELGEVPGSTVWTCKRDTITNYNNAAGIGYGNQFIKANDGYTYSFGSKGVFFNASNIYVARFPSNDITTWTFWNGSAWVSTPSSANAATIATSQQNVSFGYSHGKYIMMQMDLGFLCDPSSHNIYLSTSSSPTGPFTKPVKVWTIEDMDGGHIIRYYTPSMHTEFDNAKGEMLLTYSVNSSACSASVDACVNGETESRKYQVKGVRVPYSLIGL